MAEETWEIDPLQMSLRDLKVLQEGFGPDMDVSKVEAILGRLVTNRTAEEIGNLPLGELTRCMEVAMAEVENVAVPKANDTP